MVNAKKGKQDKINGSFSFTLKLSGLKPQPCSVTSNSVIASAVWHFRLNSAGQF